MFWLIQPPSERTLSCIIKDVHKESAVHVANKHVETGAKGEVKLDCKRLWALTVI